MRFGVHLAERESVCVYGVSVCSSRMCVQKAQARLHDPPAPGRMPLGMDGLTSFPLLSLGPGCPGPLWNAGICCHQPSLDLLGQPWGQRGRWQERSDQPTGPHWVARFPVLDT